MKERGGNQDRLDRETSAPGGGEPLPLGEAVELAPGVRVAGGVLRFGYTTSRGPGGQNVNKRATRCELRVNLGDLPLTDEQKARLRHAASHLVTSAGELVLSSGEHRSQVRNREETLGRLRELIVVARTRVKTRKATKPSYGSKQRRLTEKKSRGEIKRGRRQEPE